MQRVVPGDTIVRNRGLGHTIVDNRPILILPVRRDRYACYDPTGCRKHPRSYDRSNRCRRHTRRHRCAGRACRAMALVEPGARHNLCSWILARRPGRGLGRDRQRADDRRGMSSDRGVAPPESRVGCGSLGSSDGQDARTSVESSRWWSAPNREAGGAGIGGVTHTRQYAAKTRNVPFRDPVGVSTNR
jgi:hypothetical protein